MPHASMTAYLRTCIRSKVLVSDSFRFIFVHVPKAASTSVRFQCVFAHTVGRVRKLSSA